MMDADPPPPLICLGCDGWGPRAGFVFTLTDRTGICRGCAGSEEALRLAGDGDYRARRRDAVLRVEAAMAQLAPTAAP